MAEGSFADTANSSVPRGRPVLDAAGGGGEGAASQLLLQCTRHVGVHEIAGRPLSAAGCRRKAKSLDPSCSGQHLSSVLITEYHSVNLVCIRGDDDDDFKTFRIK